MRERVLACTTRPYARDHASIQHNLAHAWPVGGFCCDKECSVAKVPLTWSGLCTQHPCTRCARVVPSMRTTEPCARNDNARAPSSLVTTELSSSSVHCVVHCLSYCSFDTVHGHCSWTLYTWGFGIRFSVWYMFQNPIFSLVHMESMTRLPCSIRYNKQERSPVVDDL